MPTTKGYRWDSYWTCATGADSTDSDGGSKFRGACYFETTAPSLMSINGNTMVYEWDVDAGGSANWNIWHWA